ncbi:MAG: hypothetical protein K2K74_08725 [Lachnospiraceae bacterium]|nr:hypothetical protein [Lachnospiraceae bacterium]
MMRETRAWRESAGGFLLCTRWCVTKAAHRQREHRGKDYSQPDCTRAEQRKCQNQMAKER